MLPEKMIFIDPTEVGSPERVSKTFRLDHNKQRVISQYIDGKEAIAQSIWVNLGIEKNVWNIHTREYGVEFAKLYGHDKELAMAQIESIIKRALSWDERIYSTSNYDIRDLGEGKLSVDFDVSSSAGNFRTGVSVNGV